MFLFSLERDRQPILFGPTSRLCSFFFCKLPVPAPYFALTLLPLVVSNFFPEDLLFSPPPFVGDSLEGGPLR